MYVLTLGGFMEVFGGSSIDLTANTCQAEPKLADVVDDDGRLPIHWAASSNSKDIVLLLSNRKKFDPDTQVCPGCRNNIAVAIRLPCLTLIFRM
jgi:ankyrin repeat protein